MVTSETTDDKTIITITPNRSVSWQQSKWIIVVMVVFVMIIAIAWAFVGAWVVLPFAGLEVGLFALLMYKVSIFTHSQQIIEISKSTVHVTSGYRRRQQYIELPRLDLDVYYSESTNNWELPKIALCNQQKRVVVGDFLNLEDRVKLRDDLENAGFFICKNHWWKS